MGVVTMAILAGRDVAPGAGSLEKILALLAEGAAEEGAFTASGGHDPGQDGSLGRMAGGAVARGGGEFSRGGQAGKPR